MNTIATNAPALVTLRNVSFSRESRPIFTDINLDIQRGKITAIIGPSGTGKTTLLQIIGGLLAPEAGVVSVGGQNVHALPRKALYRLRQKMGMLFQNGALFTNLNAFENVAFPLREHTNFTEANIERIVLEKLAAVGLKNASHLAANQLSGGMTRRVALARAMVLNPMLILYDEPFVGLDPLALGVIVRLIASVNERYKMTSVLVSHDVQEAFQIADYVYLIEGGHVMAQGTPETLLSHSDPSVQQFVRGVPALPVQEWVSC